MVRLFLVTVVDVKIGQVVVAEGTQEMEQVRQEQVFVQVRVDIVLQMEEWEVQRPLPVVMI